MGYFPFFPIQTLGGAYSRLRAHLATIPWVYAAYRRLSLLRRMDRACTLFLHLCGLKLYPQPGFASLGEIRRIQRLIDGAAPRRALSEASAVLARGAMLSPLQIAPLLRLAAQHGGWQLVDEVIYPSFTRWLSTADFKPGGGMRRAYLEAIEDMTVVMLEQARPDAAKTLLGLAQRLQARDSRQLLADAIDVAQAMAQEADARGRAMRAQKPRAAISQIGSIVWGEAYLEAFMHYHVRSLLAEGNLPALAGKGPVVHSIVTTEAGREFIRRHPVYAPLERLAQVEFFCFPEALLGLSKGEQSPDKLSYLLYGMLDRLNLVFARALQADLFLIPVDSIVAAGSLGSLSRYLEEGYDACGGGNLVAERERFLPAIDAACGREGVLTIDAKSLASLALAHPHHYTTSQLICDRNRNFGKHPRELFWPASGGVYAHSIYTHPLAIAARRLAMDCAFPYATADFLLPARLFSTPESFGKYKIIEDASAAYINNFAPAARRYATTGRAFCAEDFAAAHTHSYPIHRHMLKTRQFIPCEYAPVACSNDINDDMSAVERALAAYFDDRSAA